MHYQQSVHHNTTNVHDTNAVHNTNELNPESSNEKHYHLLTKCLKKLRVCLGFYLIEFGQERVLNHIHKNFTQQHHTCIIGKTENPGVLIIQDVLSQNKQEEGHDVEALHSIMICHFVQILLAHPLEDITLYFRKVVGYEKCEKHVIL
jgi:hypothetical protein